MARFGTAKITAAGAALLAQAQSGAKKGIIFTRGVSGAGYNAPGEDLTELTELKDERQSFEISGVASAGENSVSVKYVITNYTASGALTSGYAVTEIGIYARSEDSSEILYAVAVSEEPDWLPPYDELMPVSIVIDIYCNVGGRDNVSITAAEGVYALSSDLSETAERLKLIEHMVYFNDYFAPIDTGGGVLIEEGGNAILANWKYKEA